MVKFKSQYYIDRNIEYSKSSYRNSSYQNIDIENIKPPNHMEPKSLKFHFEPAHMH